MRGPKKGYDLTHLRCRVCEARTCEVWAKDLTLRAARISAAVMGWLWQCPQASPDLQPLLRWNLLHRFVTTYSWFGCLSIRIQQHPPGRMAPAGAREGGVISSTSPHMPCLPGMKKKCFQSICLRVTMGLRA